MGGSPLSKIMHDAKETTGGAPLDPVTIFLSDPESHLSDILYIYFRHYKKRVMHEFMMRALQEIETSANPLLVADVGSSCASDLLYIVRRMRKEGQEKMLARLNILLLDGDPWSKEAGEPLWADTAKDVRFEFREAYLTEPLPLEPGSVQVAVCSEVVEHMEEPKLLLQAIYTAMQPGGYLIFTTDNSPSLFQLIRRIPRWLTGQYAKYYTPRDKDTDIVGTYERKGKTFNIYGHISLKSTWEWEKVARECGFEIASYGTYESIRRGGAGSRPVVLAAFFVTGFINSCLPRWLGRYFGDTTALLLKKPKRAGA